MATSSLREENSSSPLSFISTGTAKVQSMDRLTPTMRSMPKNLMSPSSAEILETHRVPSPDIPGLGSSLKSVKGTEDEQDHTTVRRLPVGQNASLPLEEVVQERIQNVRRHVDGQGKCQAIIDPSTVRLSFVGSISSLDTPLRLEEGFQKLYRLYEQNTPKAAHLPYSVSITEIPLTTIADSLEAQIEEKSNALEECADNITALNHTASRAQQDMISLELQYSLARQEANMRAMTPDDVRLRMEWLKEEIARVDIDKEHLIRQTADSEKERDRLRKELVDMLEIGQENQKLKQINLQHERRQQEMQEQLNEAKGKLEELRFTLQSVPSPIRKMCARILVPDGEKQENIKPQKHKQGSSRFSFY